MDSDQEKYFLFSQEFSLKNTLSINENVSKYNHIMVKFFYFFIKENLPPFSRTPNSDGLKYFKYIRVRIRHL